MSRVSLMYLMYFPKSSSDTSGGELCLDGKNVFGVQVHAQAWCLEAYNKSGSLG